MNIYSVDSRVIAYTQGGAMTWVESPDVDPPPVITPLALDQRFIVTGHSIPDTITKGTLPAAITTMGGTPQLFVSTGPYATAEWRWFNRPAAPDEVRALLEAPGASYDAFMGTEAHGFGNGTTVRHTVNSLSVWPGSGEYALLWHNLAASTGAQTYYSNFWQNGLPSAAPVFDASWRAAQEIEKPRWDERIDFVNANKAAGTPNMRLVPWLQVFCEVYDAIQAGTVTGVTMADFFVDDVHVNTAVGEWVLLATVLAVVYRRHPDTLPANAVPWAPISETLAAQLRPIVWATCLSTARTGLT